MVRSPYVVNRPMSNSHFPPSVLAAVLSACATESVILNSERIEERFGSYGIEVLASEAGLRRSSLFSYDGETKICRTYAIVQFVENSDDRYEDAHSKILAGGSIGATFRESGWDIRKNTLYIGTLQLPSADNQVSGLMNLGGDAALAIHVYQLVLVRAGMAQEYATILEAHHPDYLSVAELRELFEYDVHPTLPDADVDNITKLVFRP